MDFIIKSLHTLFFGAVFFIIYMKYNKTISVKPLYIIILLLNLIVLFSLNTIYSSIPNRLLLILLMFSFSIVVLNIMKGLVSMENSQVLKNNNNLKVNYQYIKTVLFEKVIPIMVFLYQLLLIWCPVLFERMSKK